MELRCEHISKHFGAVTALNDVSLRVANGEVRALLGGNGSGKSTLAKILGGIYSSGPESVIKYGDLDLTKFNPRKAKDHGIVVTSQELSLFTNLTVAENLNITDVPVKTAFVDKAKMRGRAIEILRKIKMEDALEKEVASLPPNQLYLLEFAKALLQDPKILVIDEITSALFRDDVEIVRDIVVNDLKKRGVCVMLISHRMNEIYTMCDSVTVMRNGEVVGTYGIEEKHEDELLALMVGRTTEEIRQAAAANPACAECGEAGGLLSLSGLKLKNFGTEIDLCVRRGEVIGIAGLQGHGQSDLIRTIFGLNGEVQYELDNKPRKISSPTAAVNAGIAYISGDRVNEGVFSVRSVTENLRVVTGITKRNRNCAPDRDVLSRLGVKYGSAGQQITELSGGNQQKVIVGRWVSAEPMLLLADDPTKGIDVQARRDIHAIFRELAENGAAVLMFSSDDEELVELTRRHEMSRILVMYEGNIAAELRGEEINTHSIINQSLSKRGEGHAEQ